MFLVELHCYRFNECFGELYGGGAHIKEEWNKEARHQKSDVFQPRSYDDTEGGGFWINAYTDDVIQGQVPHVEMIRQNHELFGLTSDGMPAGDMQDIMFDDRYDNWLDKNDAHDTKLKYGVFMDGWIRGTYEPGGYLEVTGISPAIHKSAQKILNMIDAVGASEVVIELMDEGLVKNKFSLPEDEDKLKGFLIK